MTQSFSTVSANFHLTHNCNLQCTYCYTGQKFGAGMTEATANSAVDFCFAEAEKCEAGHLEFVFFGGEPLMKLDLLCQIADRAIHRNSEQDSQRRVSFKMSTNGLLLTESAVERLAERGVYVSISLDGDPATQAAQRPDVNGRDITEKLDASISRLLEWNPCATVNCVVTPASAEALDQSVAWLFERGFAYIQIALDYSAEWTRDDLNRLQSAYERLANWYVDRTLAGKLFYLSCFDTRIQARTRGPLAPDERCFIGQRQFSIAPSGRLYPCVQFVQEDRNDEFVIGDVFDGFNVDKKQSIACCAEKERNECGGCQLLDRCSSWCACVNWQSTGKLDQASPVVCEHERLLMPIADGVANRLWKKRDPGFLHKHYNPAFPVLSFAEQIVIKELENAESE